MVIGLFYQNCGKSFETSMQSRMIADDNSGLGDDTPNPPVIILNSTPPAFSNKTDVNITYSVSTKNGARVSSVKCQLDDEAEVDCLQGFSKSSLSQGNHRLRIIAKSTEMLSSKETIVDWVVDSNSPILSFTQVPPSVVSTASLTVLFSAIDNGSGINNVSCLFENKPVDCIFDSATGQGKLVINSLTPGSKSVSIKAVDKAQNTVNLEKSFNVDFSLPSVTITKGPPSLNNEISVSFSYVGASSSGEPLAKFECSTDEGKTYSACDGGSRAYLNIFVAEIKQTFMVRSIDNSGKKSSSASYTWILDKTPPSSPLINAASTTNQNIINVSFSSADPMKTSVNSGVDPQSGFVCTLNEKTISNCVSPLSISLLQNKQNVFKIKAKDRAGNFSAEAVKNINHDSLAPVITLTQSPLATTADNNANFAFTINEQIASKSCFLNDVLQSSCNSPIIFSNLDVKSHAFKIIATDLAGNIGQRIFTWQVMKEAPVVVPQYKVLFPGSASAFFPHENERYIYYTIGGKFIAFNKITGIAQTINLNNPSDYLLVTALGSSGGYYKNGASTLYLSPSLNFNTVSGLEEIDGFYVKIGDKRALNNDLILTTYAFSINRTINKAYLSKSGSAAILLYTSESVAIVNNSNYSPQISLYNGFALTGSHYYFININFDSTGTKYYKLLKVDGTTNQISLFELNTVIVQSIFHSDSQKFYFVGINKSNKNYGLWQSDGTDAGTSLIREYNVNSSNPSSYLITYDPQIFKGKLYVGVSIPGAEISVISHPLTSNTPNSYGEKNMGRYVIRLNNDEDSLIFRENSNWYYTDGSRQVLLNSAHFGPSILYWDNRTSLNVSMLNNGLYGVFPSNGDAKRKSIWKLDLGTGVETEYLLPSPNMTIDKLYKIGSKLIFSEYVANHEGNSLIVLGGNLWVHDGNKSTSLLSGANFSFTDSEGSRESSTNYLLFNYYNPATGKMTISSTEGIKIATVSNDFPFSNYQGFTPLADLGGDLLSSFDSVLYRMNIATNKYQILARNYNKDKTFFVNNNLYFVGTDKALYRTNGTSSGLQKISDNSIPVCSFSGKLVFHKDRNSLWVTDGTLAGTAASLTGISTSNLASSGCYITTNYAYFGTWRFNGSSVTVNPSVGMIASVGDKILTLSTNSNGHKVIKAQDESNLNNSANLFELTDQSGGIFFDDQDLNKPEKKSVRYFYTENNLGLSPKDRTRKFYRTDGTTSGTYIVLEIAAGYDHVLTRSFQDKMYTVLSNGDSTASYLYYSAGKPNDGILLKNLGEPPRINNGTTDKNKIFLLNHGNLVYFVNNDAKLGYDWWSTDGNSTNTKMIYDVKASSTSSAVYQSGIFGGKLYFSSGAAGLQVLMLTP